MNVTPRVTKKDFSWVLGQSLKAVECMPGPRFFSFFHHLSSDDKKDFKKGYLAFTSFWLFKYIQFFGKKGEDGRQRDGDLAGFKQPLIHTDPPEMGFLVTLCGVCVGDGWFQQPPYSHLTVQTMGLVRLYTRCALRNPCAQV